MPSRFDYRDPATDPLYCAGLQPDDMPDEHDSHSCRQCGERCADNPAVDGAHYPYCSGACMSAAHRHAPIHIDDTISDRCAWCGDPLPNLDWSPYCSSQCGLYAELDDYVGTA